MTNSNRFLNRLLVFLIGLVLVVAGGAVAVGAVLADVRRNVSTAAHDAIGPTSDALSGSQPWILWVTAAASLVLILLLLRFIVRHGHGRTNTLLTVASSEGEGSPTGGTLTIDAKVAEQILEESLARNPSIMSIHVAAFRVKKENALRITAQTTRGTSPVEVRRLIDRAVADWDALLGATTPVVIQIVGGIRNRMSGASRVQ